MHRDCRSLISLSIGEQDVRPKYSVSLYMGGMYYTIADRIPHKQTARKIMNRLWRLCQYPTCDRNGTGRSFAIFVDELRLAAKQ